MTRTSTDAPATLPYARAEATKPRSHGATKGPADARIAEHAFRTTQWLLGCGAAVLVWLGLAALKNTGDTGLLTVAALAVVSIQLRRISRSLRHHK